MPTDGMYHFSYSRSFISLRSRPIDDVLKARLKTVGVSEYRFEMEASVGKYMGPEWRIVDVGGSRSQVGFITFIDLIPHLTDHGNKAS